MYGSQAGKFGGQIAQGDKGREGNSSKATVLGGEVGMEAASGQQQGQAGGQPSPAQMGAAHMPDLNLLQQQINQQQMSQQQLGQQQLGQHQLSHQQLS